MGRKGKKCAMEKKLPVQLSIDIQTIHREGLATLLEGAGCAFTSKKCKNFLNSKMKV